ncbi:MAG: DUF1016 domain-containing protein [bacterium]|nr:DUF1016 domain-containing protein [bacterium]
MLSIRLNNWPHKGKRENRLQINPLGTLSASPVLSFKKVNALRSELTWTHYRLLLKVKRVEARNFYMLEAVENRWHCVCYCQ